MKNRWSIKPKPKEEDSQFLIENIFVPAPLAILLAQRGINSFEKAKSFFRPNLEELHNPFLMKDMDKAVERIHQAIVNNENILVYGDYDVDGTTAVSLLYEFLNRIYPNISYYIPDRYEEGYGISLQSINFADDNDIHLIIALDCGIKAHEQIIYAKQKNIDFIICDHHLPDISLPDAVAVLNPKREDCDYPYVDLSGCGIGFKLIQAYAERYLDSDEDVYSSLDLVAVSIAADIVPITGENRVLTHFGIKQLNACPRIGFTNLIPVEQRNHLTVSNIVFAIAPKINAAGRVKHASHAVRLLLCKEQELSKKYVSEISDLNDIRKELDATTTSQALKQIAENGEEERYVTMVYDSNWHKGVLGIVASRLIEVYYKPTLVFSKGLDDELVASARSVKGFDIYSAIEKNASFLERFGGHEAAAGLTIKQNNYEAFKAAMEATVKATIQQTQRISTIDIDMKLNFSDITGKFLKTLEQFAPFGPGNMTPVFLTQNVIADEIKTMGKEKSHLRFLIYQKGGRKSFPAIGFKLGELKEQLENQKFDVVYSIEKNVWRGNVAWQLNIRDIRFNS